MSTEKFTRTIDWRERWKQRWRLWLYKARVVRHIAFVGFMANTIGRLEHRQVWKKRNQGEKIWLDDLYSPPVDEEKYQIFEPVEADIQPNTHKRPRKAKLMKQEAYPSTDYGFAYRRPPLSGNVINGVGETQPRRPFQPTFFSKGYTGPWNKLERLYQAFLPVSIPNFILRIYWMDRHRLGLVAPKKRKIDDPAAMSAEIKAVAKRHGAAAVGITHLTDDMCYRDFNIPYKYAISVALPMDRETMLDTPTNETGLHIQHTYKAVGEIAIKIAAEIRQMGWPARASTNISPDSYEVLHIPVAVEAGVGTLGKHGSLITREFGSNVRLATVLTDLPLVVDGPEDIGVDDFCASCQICTTNCPPQAIFDIKQLVRGEEKWYVDFDKCIPYFAAHDGCGICIEVCPWSEPGRGPKISEKMLSRQMDAAVKPLSGKTKQEEERIHDPAINP